jgi:hypothetical protein
MATPLSTISDAAVRTWAAGETVTAALLETDPANLRVAVNLILDYLSESEKNFSASSAPTDTTNGFLHHDSSANVLNLRRSGAWEQVLTENTVGSASIAAGGGTAKGRPDLTIFKNFTQVQLAGATGALIAATIAASTLDATGAALHIKNWGTKTGASSAATVVLFIGGVSQAAHTLAANVASWVHEAVIVYTSAAAQKYATWIILNRDDTAQTDLVVVGASAAAPTTAVEVKLEVSSVGALDSIEQEGSIIRYSHKTV